MSAELTAKIVELAQKYLPLAVEILSECIRIPADHQAADPDNGTSNHEKQRLDYLTKKIVEIKAVAKAEDVYYDGIGNLNWIVQDETDGIKADDKKVVFYDGHTDTVNPLRQMWHDRLGGGLDPFNGLTDVTKVNEEQLRKELGYLPAKEDWKYLVWGRGSADQLAGVVSQVIATKILLELAPMGALKGAIVHSIGTICEEDNDGAGPIFVMTKVLPGAPASRVPDVVIHTEGTGDSRSEQGAIGIYRGQRGRMQIQVDVVGKSCHGSMPWEGKNPLAAGSYIIAEAHERYEKGTGFKDDPFLQKGTRTVSWCHLETPSDCAVPEKFTFRFDRRITTGEDPKECVADIDNLESTKKMRELGFKITVSVPKYTKPTWTGYILNNDQIYYTWITPEDHTAIQSAVKAYKECISPCHDENGHKLIPKEPRVSRWIFSTDGVGFHTPSDQTSIKVPASKEWINNGVTMYPPMFGIGAGFEQNTHKIGECADSREIKHCIALMARYPSAFVETFNAKK